tara:strand:+ start:97 stop:267 length:171 start_codon:yes stop_codon:yes gene_type:complete
MNMTKILLTILVVAVIGILGLMIYQSQQKSPAQQMADDFGEVTEEIGDEIDDATTN